MMSPKNDVGKKLDRNGSFLPFPGLSVISFIPCDSLVYDCLVNIQEKVKNSIYKDNFSYLPPSSFHMTVFDLLCDFERIQGKWSKHFSLYEGLDIITDKFSYLLRSKTFDADVSMSFKSLLDYDITLKVLLEPSDFKTARILSDFRMHLSELTGIRHPNHVKYQFHISLAYLRDIEVDHIHLKKFLFELENEFREKLLRFRIDDPVFVSFKDMTEFLPIKKGR